MQAVLTPTFNRIYSALTTKTKPIRYLDVARKEYEAEIDYLLSEGMNDRALRFKAKTEKAEKDIQKHWSGA